jgi:hypothetical protein
MATRPMQDQQRRPPSSARLKPGNSEPVHKTRAQRLPSRSTDLLTPRRWSQHPVTRTSSRSTNRTSRTMTIALSVISFFSVLVLSVLWIDVSTAFAVSSPRSSTDLSASPSCDRDPERLHLIDEPYNNYFYSDCNSASQVVITTPLSSSNLKLISPRLLVSFLEHMPINC